jgi:hypothetical protein
MLNFKQKSFLNNVFGITEEDILNMSKEKWIDIKMQCFEIEGAEAMKIADKNTAFLSEYGEIAASIVDTRYTQLFA